MPNSIPWNSKLHAKVPGASLQQHPVITCSAQQKALLLNTELHLREDGNVNRNYKNKSSLEAKLLKFSQNPNKPP